MAQKKEYEINEKDIQRELDKQEKDGFKEYNRMKEASERWEKNVKLLSQKLSLPQNPIKCEIYNCKNDWKVRKKLKSIKGKNKIWKICKHDSDYIERQKSQGLTIGQLEIIEKRLVNIIFVDKKNGTKK